MGIEGINARIADIQSRIIGLQTQAAGKVAPTRQVTTTSAAGGDSFASYLQNAVAADPAAAGRTFQLDSEGVPADLAAYGNGKIPAAALGQVGGTGHRLWAPAAESLTRMIDDAKKDGVRIGITDSYRPYAEQVDLAKRKGLYSQGGLAAKPGTSEHGWGMATDLDLNSSALAWMRQHGEKYGYVNNVARENWHWAYKPQSVTG